MDLQVCLSYLREFLTPTSSKLDQEKLSNLTLTSILNQNIDEFKKKHEDFYKLLNIDDENDVLWKYCVICLQLVDELNRSKFVINENNCYLSVNDENLLTKSCEFISCFGMHYNYEDYVGIPIEKLSKFGFVISNYRSNVNIIERNKRLNYCLNKLYEIKRLKREHVNIISVFYKRYLHDILCSLIQLVYSSNNSCLENKELFKNWLEIELFDEIETSSIVRSLIMTQGCDRTKAPTWFLNSTGDLLTKCVMRPSSVMSVIKAVLDEVGALSSSSTQDWRKCDLVARILSTKPRTVAIEEYFQFISPQILKLFSIEDAKLSRHLCRVAGSVYSLFAKKWPQLTQIHLTKPIISPIDLQTVDNVDSETLNKTLKLIHLVFVTCTEPNWSTLNQLNSNLLHLLFKLYTFARDKNTCKNTRQLCEDVLRLYLTLMENKQNNLIELLMSFLQSSIIDDSSFSLDIQCENVVASDAICIKVCKNDDESNEMVPTIEQVEKRCHSICDLISKLNDETIEIEFLFYLFENLKEVISDKMETNKRQTKNDQTFLKFEDNVKLVEKNFNMKILVLTQLSYLFEQINPEILIKNSSKVIEFCKLLLESVLLLIGSSEDQVVNEIIESEHEVLYLILSILTIFTSGIVEIDYEIKKKLQVLLPDLEKLKEFYKNTDIASLADVIHVSIATYGAIKTENEHVTTAKPKRVLIEEINDEEKGSAIETKPSNIKEETLDNALKELDDPLLPVRGHGLILLRKLIDKKDNDCLKQIDNFYEIFVKNLQNDDSYIYLASINGLISLASYQPDRVLHTLLQEYSQSKKLDADSRLKIGEVLTKFVRNLSDFVPHYGHLLLSIFLNGCKSDDELIRASSLSNIGETCKLLNYKLTENLVEIINCISTIIDTDKSTHVKRSAILVLKLLLEGLDKRNFIDVLGDSILSLYRVIKKVITTTDDDVIKLHATIAYEYLDELMKTFLFPKQILEKEIKISN